MPLAECRTAVDEKGYELVDHGSPAFPIACYNDDLSIQEVPWHWHDELEAVVIESGWATVSAGNQSYTVGPGDGFFVNAGILHGCWDLDDSGCRFHSLVFHPRLVGGSLDSVIYQNYVLPLIRDPGLETVRLTRESPRQAEALDMIEKAWQSGVHEPEGYEFTVRDCLSRLVFLLRRSAPAPLPHPGTKAARDSQRIKQMLQFIHSHYPEELNTDAIAASAMISQSECLRCFRATIGTSPIQYLRQYRIQRAAHLLTATAEPVSEIAAQCGFQDVSYFTKTFREMKGCAPARYRKRSAEIGQNDN